MLPADFPVVAQPRRQATPVTAPSRSIQAIILVFTSFVIEVCFLGFRGSLRQVRELSKRCRGGFREETTLATKHPSNVPGRWVSPRHNTEAAHSGQSRCKTRSPAGSPTVLRP